MRTNATGNGNDAASVFAEAANWVLIGMAGVLTLAAFLVRF